MEVTQDIKLNINDTGDRYVVTVKQGDTGRKLLVTMCDGQTELTIPSTATVSVRVLKADGTSVDDTATVSDGKAIVELTEQMTAVVGYAKADVSVASDGKIVSTATFFLKVGAVPLGVAIVSENEFTQLSNLIASVSQFSGTVTEVQDIRTGYDGTTYSSAGDAVRSQIQAAINNGMSSAQVNTLIEQYIEEHHITGVTDEEIQAMIDDYLESGAIETSVADWLDAHPEATTTVQDGSITQAKLANDVLELIETSAPVKMSNVLNVGQIFTKPEDLPYCGWPFNNIQYDADLNAIVFLISAHVQHGDSTNSHLYMGKMSLDTYDVTIAEIGNPTTLGHGFYTMGFCINDDGEYLYIDAQSQMLGKSTDKGVTWTETSVSAYNSFPESITQLSNGRYLFWGDGSTKGVWYSDDDCATWTKATMSGAKYEGSFLELTDGKVMCFMRKSTNSTTNGAWNGTKIKEPIVISVSNDYGTTWSTATDSTTLLEGSANIATAFYHKDEDLIEVFTSPRYPYGDTKGAIFQYIAKKADALDDKFGTPKVVTYAKAIVYQDFGHIGGCFDGNGDMHLMYYDGDASASGSVNYYYMKASRNQVTLPIHVKNSSSLFLPLSGSDVTGLIATSYNILNNKINALIINSGGTVDDDSTSYTMNGLSLEYVFAESNYDSETSSFKPSIYANNTLREIAPIPVTGGYSTSNTNEYQNNYIYWKTTDTNQANALLAIFQSATGYSVEIVVERISTQLQNNFKITFDGFEMAAYQSVRIRNYSESTANTSTIKDSTNTDISNTILAQANNSFVNDGFVTICYVYDRTNDIKYIYCDGVEVYSTENVSPLSGYSWDIADMANVNFANRNFRLDINGSIRGVRFYNKPLSANELLNNYNYEKNLT